MNYMRWFSQNKRGNYRDIRVLLFSSPTKTKAIKYLQGSQNQGSVEAELTVDAIDPLSETP